MAVIKKGIDENSAKLEKMNAEAKTIQDMMILQNGALQECAYWIEQMRYLNIKEISFEELTNQFDPSNRIAAKDSLNRLESAVEKNSVEGQK